MSYFTPALFKFLRDLKKNNNRDWFKANQARYESAVREPALAFITAFGPHLHRISPYFRADAKKVGGSMFRIHRDVRFGKDKSPYKTNTGLHFRHEAGKDAHAPGFYVHLEPGGCFVGAGIWRPDGPSTRSIREAIAERPKEWKRAAHGKKLTGVFELGGQSLKRPPPGFDKEHTFIDDLKRKDFIAIADLSQAGVTAIDFDKQLGKTLATGAPLVKFLCGALGVSF
jgi:uncharacterized protein (TIGR02453 family)